MLIYILVHFSHLFNSIFHIVRDTGKIMLHKLLNAKNNKFRKLHFFKFDDIMRNSHFKIETIFIF